MVDVRDRDEVIDDFTLIDNEHREASWNKPSMIPPQGFQVLVEVGEIPRFEARDPRLDHQLIGSLFPSTIHSEK